MYIVTDNLEIINFSHYRDLSIEEKNSGEGQLVLTTTDGSKRVIAEFYDVDDAVEIFYEVCEALSAGKTYYIPEDEEDE